MRTFLSPYLYILHTDMTTEITAHWLRTAAVDPWLHCAYFAAISCKSEFLLHNVVLKHPVPVLLLPFVHTCNHHLKCNADFHLPCILLEHVSVSLGHHQVCTLLLKLLNCHLSMPHGNALLFLNLKTLNPHTGSENCWFGYTASDCQLWVFSVICNNCTVLIMSKA